jgi:putative adenylate-forming enzyme
LRWNRFQNTLKKSPFYAELANSKASLSDYPIMDKASFMNHFDLVNTENISFQKANSIALEAESSRNFSPMIGDISVGLSSGTSGNRSIFLSSKKERAQWVAAVLDRVIGLSFRHRRVAFILRANNNLYSAVKSRTLQFEFFDLLTPMEEHLEKLTALNPTILVAQPSGLLELASFQRDGSLNIQPEKIISVAEVLYPEDQIILETTFGMKIHQVYQCTEGFLASTCKEGTLHFHEDFLIIEKQFIDQDQSRFHPVITDLLRETQPIVRYELNDIIIEKKGCSCGSNHLAIEQIEGRSDDVFVFDVNGRSIKVFPDFLRRSIIMADADIIDYTLVQKSKNMLELYVNQSEKNFEKAQKAIQTLLTQYGIHQVTIKSVDHKQHQIGSKLRRIINAI